MSSSYNTVITILSVGVFVALVMVVVSLVGVIVCWNTPKRRGHVTRLFAAIIAIPCLWGIHFANLFLIELPSMGRERRAEYNAAGSLVQVGDMAPEFSLRTADGNDVSLPANGKVTVINFFATWCEPCRMELPYINQIWMANKNDPHFCLLVVGREETTGSVREFRESKGFTFPIAADPDRAVYSQFAIQSIPRTLVVAPDGRVVYAKRGFREDDLRELTAVIEEQLANANGLVLGQR